MYERESKNPNRQKLSLKDFTENNGQSKNLAKNRGMGILECVLMYPGNIL